MKTRIRLLGETAFGKDFFYKSSNPNQTEKLYASTSERTRSSSALFINKLY